MKHAMDHPITPTFLLRFTLPSIVMMIVLSMYTVVDGTLVSHLVGTEAFSAINVVYPILGVVVALGTMFERVRPRLSRANWDRATRRSK